MKNKKLLLLCIGLLMTTQMIFSQVPSYVPTNGLVGYWPFNGNANDQSGNSNNGTPNGATLTTDRFGNANSAYNFDGVNDLISTSDSNTLNISNNITMSAWVYDVSDSQNYHTILNKRINGNWSYGVSFSYYFGPGGSPTEINKVFSGRRNNFGAQTEYKFSNEPIVFGQWIHIVVKIENNLITFYKNGIDMGVNLFGNQFTIPMINQAVGLTIGSNGDGGEWFNGKLDDIGIWNRALTQQEITNLYNANQCINTITVTDTLIINVGQLSFTNPVTYANNITISPNPASTQVNISFNNITDLTGGTIKIMNSLGQQVATTPITATGTNTTMGLNSWGGNGLYFVQIVNAQGQIVDIKKIILQ
ncbi:MAG: LamG-like jellyroll fold domain-containing protein [Flavobacterium sp.]